MSKANKSIFSVEVDNDTLTEFMTVVETISTDEEPFDVGYWLESKMEEFIKQQKESMSWNNYNKQ